MKDVFISYNSQIREAAETIRNCLEDNKVTCFLDKYDISGGRAWPQTLTEELENCEVLVFLYSKQANENPDYVESEIRMAKNNKKTCITLLLDDSKMRSEFDFFLGNIQNIQCYPDSIDTYLPTILEAVKILLPEKEKVFTYDAKRGIMKNVDGNRNVSFRTETFINMMGGIYDDVKNLVGETEAESIFFRSGYESGRRFAINRKDVWDYGYTAKGIKRKFDEWCKFDSNVGWGKFSADLEIDEENNSISGNIRINEAFIVDTTNERKICSFIRGYCDGVAEVLLNSSKVELTCAQCPLKNGFRNKTECVFKIELKENI